MRSLAAALTLGVAFSVLPFTPSAQAGHVHAQQVQQKKHARKGTISSVDGDTVTVSIASKNGDKKDHPFKTDSNTKITLDGKEAKLADLKAGQTVKVTPGDTKNDPVVTIAATSATAGDSK
jgi:Cu/Ag efflux protein CusF